MKRGKTLTQNEVEQQDNGRQELEDLPLTPLTSEELKLMQAELPGMPPKPQVEKTTKIRITRIIDKKGEFRYIVFANGHPSWETEIEVTRLKRQLNSLLKKGITIDYYEDNTNNL